MCDARETRTARVARESGLVVVEVARGHAAGLRAFLWGHDVHTLPRYEPTDREARLVVIGGGEHIDALVRQWEAAG
jgi:hypothetical protein